jgi:hypothetical protein
MKFYPQDWRSDEKLRMCSLAARGLWIEMLALMHRSERYGHLLVSGRVPTDAQLAVLVGAPHDQLPMLLAELDGAGVFSRAASGAIYSRRMTRDKRKSEKARRNGKKGGDASLGKNKEKAALLKQQLKPPLKHKEARSQKPEEANASPRAKPELMIELCEIASIPPPDPGCNFDKHKAALDTVDSWLDAGADPVLIRETLAQRCANLRTSPRSLAFFDKPVREAVESRKAEASRISADTGSLIDRILKKDAA